MNILSNIKNFIVLSLMALAIVIIPQTALAKASWYGPGFHGKLTANGERYDMYAMTAAHKTLPFGTMVEVTNNVNGKKVIVRINDRGPFKKGREIDLSKAANNAINCGLCSVDLRIVEMGDGKTYHGKYAKKSKATVKKKKHYKSKAVKKKKSYKSKKRAK